MLSFNTSFLSSQNDKKENKRSNGPHRSHEKNFLAIKLSFKSRLANSFNYPPFEKVVVLHLNLSQKYTLSNDFKMSSTYFRYFAIISLWKVSSFIWTNLNPLIQRCLVPSLVENGPVVLGEIGHPSHYSLCVVILFLFDNELLGLSNQILYVTSVYKTIKL